MPSVHRLLLIITSFSIVIFHDVAAQCIVVKDISKTDGINFCMVDTSEHADNSLPWVTGIHHKFEPSQELTVTGRRVSQHYAYIDGRPLESSGFCLLRGKIGYSDEHVGLMNGRGEVVLPIHPDASIIVDTRAQRIYRKFYNYRKGGFLKMEVFDYELNTINVVTESSLGYQPKMNGSTEMDAWSLLFMVGQELVSLEHRVGVMLLDKDLHPIKDFRHHGLIEYKSIKRFKNGFGILSMKIDGESHDVIINKSGDIVYDNRRVRLNRVDEHVFEEYHYALEKTSRLHPSGGTFVAVDCRNPFSSIYDLDFSAFQTRDFTLVKGDYNASDKPQTNRFDYALSRKSGCDYDIILPDFNDRASLDFVRISERHGLLNSRGGALTSFYLVDKQDDGVFAVDEYLSLIELPDDFDFIEHLYKYRGLGKVDYDPIWVYQINQQFYIFNPNADSENMRSLGPFQSVSKAHGTSFHFGDVEYLLHNADGKTTRLRLNDENRWQAINVVQSVQTRQGANGRQGVWSTSSSGWLIEPQFRQVNYFLGYFFGQNSEDESYTVFSENGEFIQDGIDVYDYWFVPNSVGHPNQTEDNGYGMMKTTHIRIVDKMKICHLPSGRISYSGGDYEGLLLGGKAAIAADYTLWALPDGFVSGRRDVCDELSGVVWSPKGKVLWESRTHYLYFDTRSMEYVLKSFALDPQSGQYAVVARVKNLEEAIPLKAN